MQRDHAAAAFQRDRRRAGGRMVSMIRSSLPWLHMNAPGAGLDSLASNTPTIMLLLLLLFRGVVAGLVVVGSSMWWLRFALSSASGAASRLPSSPI